MAGKWQGAGGSNEAIHPSPTLGIDCVVDYAWMGALHDVSTCQSIPRIYGHDRGSIDRSAVEASWKWKVSIDGDCLFALSQSAAEAGAGPLSQLKIPTVGGALIWPMDESALAPAPLSESSSPRGPSKPKSRQSKSTTLPIRARLASSLQQPPPGRLTSRPIDALDPTGATVGPGPVHVLW